MNDSHELKTGIVCILDALGTKGVWNRNNPSTVLKKWDELIDSFVSLSGVKIKGNVKFDSPPNVKAFSDTIMITYHGSNLEDLMVNMASHVMIPFCHALEDGIYLRGVISIGEFYESKNSLIGPAIDEAVEWYEKGDWFGVFLTPSASYITDTFTHSYLKDSSAYLVKYDVPLKNNTEIKTWALNWPNYLGIISVERSDEKINGKYGTHSQKVLLNSFSKSTIFGDSYSKYQNSKAFFDKYIRKD